MSIFFLLIIFWGIIFVFGWQLSRWLLNEKRIEALIPLAITLGFSVYLFLLNLFSYFISIKINFYLLIFLLASGAFFFYRSNQGKEKAEWGVNKKWRKILFSTCFLFVILTGIIGVRSLGNEDLNHLPLSATIAQGNFPVKDITSPNFPSQYHYGYNLFSAAISGFTGMPIWFSQDIQLSILAGVIFLLGFLLTQYFCKDNFKAYIASLVMVLGGNLNFLYGVNVFLSPLPDAPFKFLSDMIFGFVVFRSSPLITYSQAAWPILGFTLLLAIIYLYFRALDDHQHWLKIAFIGALVFSFLALSAELFFGALAITLLIYPLIFWFFKKDREKGRLYLKISLFMLFLAGFLAIFQGGIVTQSVKQMFLGGPLPLEFHTSITPEYFLRGMMYMGEAGPYSWIPFFSPLFFLEWGWLIILIIPAFIYLLQRYSSLGLFLAPLVFVSFLIPLIVNMGFWQGEIINLHYLTTFMGNLVVGLFLGSLILFLKAKWQKLCLIILLFLLVLQGLIYLAVFPVFPDLKKNQPFLGEPTQNAAEAAAMEWIKSNTDIRNYFLTFGAYLNSRFIIISGRMAPTFYHQAEDQLSGALSDAFMPEAMQYGEILQECKASALLSLNYRYLYVNENWPQGLEEKCLTENDLELNLSLREGQNFVRIYLIR